MQPPEIILDLAQKISDSNLSIAIAESSWMFPVLEFIHIVGLTIVVGTIAAVDLRLMNIASRHRSIRELTDETLPFTYAGFALAVVSGLLMFASDATGYAQNLALQIKLLLLVVAGINIMLFHKLTYKSVAGWDQGVTPPASAWAAGAISIVSWILIVGFGRWIAFLY